jgi:hypothetical protein
VTAPAFLDPVRAADAIERRYLSYLTTTFPLRDPVLANDLRDQLTQGAKLRKGPFLQATPPYRPGRTLYQLADEGTLATALLDVDPTALPPDRPLYAHQEQAIRLARAARNAVVATGTGSGKTECYLLPILDHLLREREAGTLAQPGVRALLLYPMNALANDQLKRVRELFAPFPDITFGRYVGDTKHRLRDAIGQHRSLHGHDPLPNELIDRESMQSTPPHLLVTNYAMLEYLLLRPADSTLFDGPTGEHWRFVVLDEVHVYDGAKGGELAMLLRRLRDRVNRSTVGALTCIATSATLGRGVQDSPEVAAFASKLFGEPFEASDVVLPDRLPLADTDANWSITAEELEQLHGQVTGAQGERFSLPASAPAVADGEVSATLHRLLRAESHVVALQGRVERGAVDPTGVCELPEFDGWTVGDVIRLVDLCALARPDQASASLLPARYHLFLRSSEGAFVCLSDKHPAGAPRLRLDRARTCAACALVGVTSAVFEIAACRNCGAHYLVGTLTKNAEGDTVLTGAESTFAPAVHLLPRSVVDAEAADEDEEAAEANTGEAATLRMLCLGCGRLSDDRACGCGGSVIEVVAAKDSKPTKLTSCLACGRRSGAGLSVRFSTGSEAPVSVLASELYQQLPAVPGATRRASAAGRKLLMFSDSRQDAAFFAPYLERTYGRSVERRLLWQWLSTQDGGARAEDIVGPVRSAAERCSVLDEDDGKTNAQNVRTWVDAEILATDRRQSLDGVGLVEIVPRLPARYDPPRALLEAGLSEDEAFDVLRVLLETLRLAACVTVDDANVVREDPRFAPRNALTVMREQHSEAGVLSWMPGRGTNKRLDYLARVLRALGSSIEPTQLLRRLWIEEITARDSILNGVVAHLDDRKLGTVFALAGDRIEFIPRSDGHLPFRCATCQQLTWRSVRGVCPTLRCGGQLVVEREPAANHYRDLYEGLQPLPLVVREHTGQLRAQHAAQLQEQFTIGTVNALSCSTTFELGVDLGEVQAVLMRNVPPSPANYVQRAGRAGRRLGLPALVTTFAQRRSHDRTYFDNPRLLVDGSVTPPIIALDNDAIARRHVHATAFSSFLRRLVEASESAPDKVGGFFLPEDKAPVIAFTDWLATRPAALHGALQRWLPPDVAVELGIDDWAWTTRLIEPDDTGWGGWLSAAHAEIVGDLRDLEEQERDAASRKLYRRAGVIERTRKTLEGRRLIDFLAQRGVLPKYGFPVDVVELDVTRSEGFNNEVELQRDLRLALLEFAPGARLVAAGNLWESVGLRKPPGREFITRSWGMCSTCGAVRTRIRSTDDDSLDERPCECGGTEYQQGRRGTFLSPVFGFLGKVDPQPPGEQRPLREGFLETFFEEFDGPIPEPEIIELGGIPVQARSSKRGWITVFNRGRSKRGFRVCTSCGYATDQFPATTGRKKLVQPEPHRRPMGERECKERLRNFDLAHRYLTNVIELNLAGMDEAAAWSTLDALIASAPAIGIADGDLDGSVSRGLNNEPAIVLYDDVPGGAGHTRAVSAELGALFAAAHDRVSNCSCGEDTSCYGCLRRYRNQLRHEKLERGAARDALARHLGR